MARFTRIEVINKIGESGMVPLFYHPDIETGKRIIKAVYDGGARVVEFTNRGDFAHDVFEGLNKFAAEYLPDLAIGIGSIVDAPTAALYMQLGAAFIVSPLLNPEMAKVCNRRKVLWVPGCATASEVSYAEELGAELVKIFPAGEVGGPAYVSAIKGPMPWSNLMPSGGVDSTTENLRAWFDAGAFCVGMGSKLISKEIIQNNDYTRLTADVHKTLITIKTIRKPK